MGRCSWFLDLVGVDGDLDDDGELEGDHDGGDLDDDGDLEGDHDDVGDLGADIMMMMVIMTMRKKWLQLCLPVMILKGIIDSVHLTACPLGSAPLYLSLFPFSITHFHHIPFTSAII